MLQYDDNKLPQDYKSLADPFTKMIHKNEPWFYCSKHVVTMCLAYWLITICITTVLLHTKKCWVQPVGFFIGLFLIFLFMCCVVFLHLKNAGLFYFFVQMLDLACGVI